MNPQFSIPFVSIDLPPEQAHLLDAELRRRQIRHEACTSRDTPPPASVALVHVSTRQADAELRCVRQLAVGGAHVIAEVDGDFELAAAAGRAGAAQVVRAPMAADQLAALPVRAQQAAPRDAFLLSSESAVMRRAIELVTKSAASDAPVLMRGESGTGKTALAEVLHARSRRAAGPLVAVSCPSIPETLLAAELFGHTRGAFTGAVREREGRVEAAHGGTLFLDEIGDMSAGLQAQLLRFLQDGSFERLGENRSRHADVRIVAATNRDLEADIESGRFRLDLYYRLSVVDVRLPALRDRPEDLAVIAGHLLSRLAAEAGRSAPRLSPAAMARLLSHAWPGNVRELENELARALLVCTGDIIDASDLSDRLADAEQAPPFLGGHYTLEQIEREHIARVLARAKSFEAAAQELGIDDSTLWRKRKRMQLAQKSTESGKNGSAHPRAAGAAR